jgi:hypothetical protein
MRRLGSLVLIGLAGLAASTVFAGPPTSTAWDKIVGARPDTMDAAQKARVESILSSVANTRGCKGTLA